MWGSVGGPSGPSQSPPNLMKLYGLRQYWAVCWGPLRAFKDPPKPCEITWVWAILCCSLVLSAWGHSDLPRFPKPCQIIWVWQYVGICWGPFRAFSDPPKPCEIISVLESIGLPLGFSGSSQTPPNLVQSYWFGNSCVAWWRSSRPIQTHPSLVKSYGFGQYCVVGLFLNGFANGNASNSNVLGC